MVVQKHTELMQKMEKSTVSAAGAMTTGNAADTTADYGADSTPLFVGAAIGVAAIGLVASYRFIRARRLASGSSNDRTPSALDIDATNLAQSPVVGSYKSSAIEISLTPATAHV